MSSLSLEARERHGARCAEVQMRWSDAELVVMLADVARQLGRTPGVSAFDETVGVRLAQTLIARFGSWVEACRQAGLEPNRKPRGFGEPRFFEPQIRAAYERISALVGVPSYVEWDRLRVAGEPTAVGMRKRYGNWTRFLRAMGAA